MAILMRLVCPRNKPDFSMRARVILGRILRPLLRAEMNAIFSDLWASAMLVFDAVISGPALPVGGAVLTASKWAEFGGENTAFEPPDLASDGGTNPRFGRASCLLDIPRYSPVSKPNGYPFSYRLSLLEVGQR